MVDDEHEDPEQVIREVHEEPSKYGHGTHMYGNINIKFGIQSDTSPNRIGEVISMALEDIKSKTMNKKELEQVIREVNEEPESISFNKFNEMARLMKNIPLQVSQIRFVDGKAVIESVPAPSIVITECDEKDK